MAFIGKIWSGARDTVSQVDALYKEYLILDQDSTLPLKNALKSLKALIDQQQQTQIFDEANLTAAIQDLEVITSAQEPRLILAPYFPQEKEDDATRLSEEAQRKCHALALLLSQYNSPGLDKPSMEELVHHLTEVYKTLHELENAQLGP